MVSLLHVRLLLGLLTTLCCVSGGDTYANSLGGIPELARSCDTRRACESRVGLSLRQERLCKLEAAPEHPLRKIPDALLVHETGPDDEDLTEAPVAQGQRFPALTRHEFVTAIVRPLRPPQTQLERPPRA